MNDVPNPLEREAQETVEAYLEHDAAPTTVLDRVAVLHHRGEYFEALDVLVRNDAPVRDADVASGSGRRGIAD